MLNYQTRVQKFDLDVNPVTGQISKFRVKKTIKFTDPNDLLSAPTNPAADPAALNSLNPLALNGDAGALGRSFDPEGLVINPRNGRLIIADEYGPSVYEFNRRGQLIKVFVTPTNLVPKVSGSTNYVADRDGGLNAGRQDNRGFEGLAVTPVDTVLPNGKKAEKWEGLAIGPRLRGGSFIILAGNDNDYSVTQNANNVQFDVYVDFNDNSVQRDLDQPTMLNGIDVGPVPNGFTLIPGVLHAYKASAADLAGYEQPRHSEGD